MNRLRRLIVLTFTIGLALAGRSEAKEPDFAQLRAQVQELGRLTVPPGTHDVAGRSPNGSLRPLYFDGPAYRGQPTRIFAWYGVPDRPVGAPAVFGRLPSVVLVHGGGGTAFEEWVRRWNAHGFAALSIAVEGQTDERGPDGKSWVRHAWAGPRATVSMPIAPSP